MRAAMAIAAALCIGVGVYPAPLYSILPYPVDYVPYTMTHVFTVLQLLLFAALGFVFLWKMGWYPPELRSIVLDVDWVWRRFLPQAWSGVEEAWLMGQRAFLRTAMGCAYACSA